MKSTYKIFLLLIILVLIAPISLYVYKFGIGLWNNPTSWSELGGYIGGIYTPILTLLTLFVLCTQIYLMQQQNNQSVIQQQESILTEYFIELNNALEIKIDEIKTSKLLVVHFQFSDIGYLKKISYDQIKLINENNHKIYSLWCGINGCIKFISAISQEQSNIAKNKVIIYINPLMCRVLDKYIYTMNNACAKIGAVTPLNPRDLFYWDSTKGA